MNNLFQNIAVLVPQGEAEFEPQSVGEGIWLTITHLHAINDALAAGGLELANQLEAVEKQGTLLEAAQQVLAETEANLTTANTSIEALTAEVAVLKTKTALPIVPPAALAVDELAPKAETLATSKTSWDLQLDAEREKLK